MDIIGGIAKWAAGSVPAYPRDAVAQAGEALGDSLLWMSQPIRPETLDALGRDAAWGYVACAASAVLLLACVGLIAWDGTREAPKGKAVPVTALAQVALVAAAIAGLVGIGKTLLADSSINQVSRNAYIVATDRIVLLTAASRTDIPASAIASVSRDADGFTIETSDRRTLRMQALPGDRAVLDKALERIVKEAARGSRIIGERLG